jgi:cobalamin biosynthesis protein CobD/CbiB
MMADNRYNKNQSRNVVDIIDIKKNIVKIHRNQREFKKNRLKGLIVAFASIAIFFLLGYAVAALYIPIWVKVLLLVLIAFVGLVPGYIVAVIFH